MLTTYVDRLPESLRPFAKFVTPAAAAVLAAIIHGLISGTVRTLELEIALVGLLASMAAFLTTNGPEGLRKYAKALVPASLTLLGVVVHWIVVGEWDEATWALALSGFGASLLTFLVPTTGAVLVSAQTGGSPGEPVATSASGGNLHMKGDNLTVLGHVGEGESFPQVNRPVENSEPLIEDELTIDEERDTTIDPTPAALGNPADLSGEEAHAEIPTREQHSNLKDDA